VNRRSFIMSFGGAAAGWPLAAWAQQAERVRRIGVLINLTANDPEGHARITAFAQGLQEAGWTTGRNVRIDYRWGGAGADAMAKYAAELVALAPDVILAATSSSVAPLQRITRTIPIVFVQVIDPVSAGFVASLARPGGNATGFTTIEYGFSGKWLEVLKEVAPHTERRSFAILPVPPRWARWVPSNPWRRRSAWSCAPSRRVTPARWSARSRHSRAPAMAV
jgi:putative tryptophan/tyrosine transport system substrate-binding protein